ncbi:hypothetical protein BG454_13725 [Roseinatronobacter bogoriensis subsp. barguzinensis]|uniref:Uncharacterized protein n=1 Tax=Roseinatronobacter bogoriensis subsp. barguzinensis TaxID=441209 RepID=A0A2K8KIU3_9RHOB|nr:hypothetical protein BG454_13725 [Rhodobaca barguzinensis]
MLSALLIFSRVVAECRVVGALSCGAETTLRGVKGVSPPRLNGPSPGTAIWLAIARSFDFARMWQA